MYIIKMLFKQAQFELTCSLSTKKPTQHLLKLKNQPNVMKYEAYQEKLLIM